MSDVIEKTPMGQADKTGNGAKFLPSALSRGPLSWNGIRRFVEGLMGGWPARAGGVVWTTGFTSSAAGESWHGRAGLDWLERAFPGLEGDLYLSIGVMDNKPGPGGKPPRRSNTAVIAQPILIVDDVGTKVDRAKWEELFALGCPRPTARVQTSPGNETWFWALAGDATDPRRWTDLALIRAWLVEQGLTDEVMDVSRYVRLPGGWNSKPKYRGEDGAGDPPKVELLEWRLDEDGRVDVEALGAVIVGGVGGAGTGAQAWRQADFPASASGRAMMDAAQIGAGLASGALVRSADLGSPDPLMRLWQECGGGLTQRGAGVVEAHCPNMAAHSTRVDTGFAFLGGGLMHCNHASCQGHSTVEFRQMMMQAYDERQAGRRLLGLLGAGEPQTAVEYLARESVRDAGGLSDTGEAVATAARMAANRAARIQMDAADENGDGKRKRAKHDLALDFMQLHGIVPRPDAKDGGVVVCVGGRWVNLSWAAGFNVLLGWLTRNGIGLTGTARKHLTETLEALAAANEPVEVFYRVAASGPPDNPTIYVNLMDAENRAIEIKRGGWKVVKVADAPVVLMHRPGGLPQALPVRANDGLSFLDRILRHVPLAPVLRPNDPRDEGVMQRAALLTFLIAQVVRVGAVPHLLLAGEQGGGKTTAARRMNDLTDPDKAAVLSRLAADEAGVFAQLGQMSNVVLDNTSGVRAEHADILCCLATGASYSARRLYTNNERTVASALCSVIFTSVLDSGITRRPDLQDRLLNLATPPLPKEKRRSESELDAAWAADLPHLLADLFDLLAVGLEHVGAVRAAQRMGFFPAPPRFADVAQVAEAAAWHRLGWPAGLLTQAINNLRAAAAEDQLSDDPIAYRLRELLRQQPGGVWRGSYEDLENVLGAIGGPYWDRNRIRVKTGVSRVLGPLRDRWGIERAEAGRKHCRIYDWRLREDRASGGA